MDLRRRSALLLSATALLAAGALTGCGGEDAPVPTGSGSDSGAGSGAQGTPEPNAAGVENELEGLGSVLKISLPEVESYDLEGSALVIRFGEGSKDDVNSHCLITRSAAQGLGLPEDHRLVMAYPDGERECA